MTETIAKPKTAEDRPLVQTLISRISLVEIVVAAVVAVVMLALVVIEPNIVEAPFENARTLLFTFGGTALAGIGFIAMLWGRVPPVVRILVLGIPFALVNWWLLSPYFVDDVVDEEFSVSISSQLAAADTAPEPAAAAEPAEAEPAAAAEPAEPTDDRAQGAAASDPAEVNGPDGPDDDAAMAEATETDGGAPEAPAETEAAPPEPTATATPSGPVLVGAGQFAGLAGHRGAGDAGLFRDVDGSLLLRFENFDIENGPDLEVYLVPGADQVSLPDGSIHLGALKGNIGDQNYVLADGTQLAPGPYTVLIWCEAFSVEFVGATITI